MGRWEGRRWKDKGPRSGYASLPPPPTPQPGPSPWVGGSALAIAGLTSGNLSGLSEYLELVPLPTEALRSDLMGLMAADFCLCWIIDKLLTKAFAY